MILGIDNGNYNTKSSEGMLYASGFTCSATAPISLENVLEYNGRFYCLGDRRLPVQANKALTEDVFILSLPAMAAAVSESGDSNINLGVGLPIMSYGNQKTAFAEYFMRSASFKWCGQPCSVTVENCRVFPQGYAALISQLKQLKDHQTIYLIDIGGYTVDIMAVVNGKPDKSLSISLPLGVIKLYGDISTELLSNNITLTEQQLTMAISETGRIEHMDADWITSVIDEMRREYIKNLLNSIRERGVDMRSPVALAGGGAELLNKHLTEQKINLVATLDRFANAKGYKILMGG